ncbi:type II toxin-antitoxin system VapC family toxin [Acinetobacter baumannii]|uniref:type II toxin-antitoxin system VapC family toxin n=1 Tax=Acinetobacter calcoaceticus/baumannii complex TaxID=909768 RepID=UPI002449E4B0|nr:type II toxin-antitoxin system VapC family toxin [Acinetobacter baumannii]MDH2601903.1 type II toxin-antitoxin system VapC family toxin [Acinetobacter baumannii]MDV7557642.1 type II toxin-antitoxin system VapC family toxin [Acinetobacter baumannii]
MIILDTNALITLLTADKVSAEYLNLVAYLKQCERLTQALPMPAIAEFIAGDENESRSSMLLSPNSKFKNLDFDAKAALIAARIYKDYKKLPKNQKSQNPHQKVKVDIQILGIALANNAKMIVTCDRGIKTIIDALDLSISVFDYADCSYLNEMTKLVFSENNHIQ